MLSHGSIIFRVHLRSSVDLMEAGDRQLCIKVYGIARARRLTIQQIRRPLPAEETQALLP